MHIIITAERMIMGNLSLALLTDNVNSSLLLYDVIRSLKSVYI